VASRVSSGSGTQRAFFDSNVLVYADDPRDAVKQERALRLIEDHMKMRSGVVSVQVLQEYFVTVTKKYKLNAELARMKVAIYARFQVVEPGVADILAAIDLHRLHGLSYWDALIVHSAKRAGCRQLLTEDLQHGQTIDGVRIVNPFLAIEHAPR
jgi:predicted nucleic acid-binding protein